MHAVHAPSEQRRDQSQEHGNRERYPADASKHRTVDPDRFNRLGQSRSDGATFLHARELCNQGCNVLCERVGQNHVPMRIPVTPFGESLVIIDKPIGDKQSSPVACKK